MDLTSSDDPPDWRAAAACRHADTEMFFPEGTSAQALLDTAQAKLICGICPVRTPCLLWALDHGTAHGIWGGRTEEERRAVRGILRLRRPGE